jgi:Putative secretion activating protein
MKTLNFDLAFDRLIGHERGYVNDPNDPGGETNWGISKRTYPDLDIAALTREDAKAIYLRDFWLPVQGETLPASIAYQLFDFAVNSGIDTAIRYFQRAIGVADDGHFGPYSKAIAAKTSESDMVMGLCAERLDFMTRLQNWKHHGKGWARRIAGQLRYGVQDTD